MILTGKGAAIRKGTGQTWRNVGEGGRSNDGVFQGLCK